MTTPTTMVATSTIHSGAVTSGTKNRMVVERVFTSTNQTPNTISTAEISCRGVGDRCRLWPSPVRGDTEAVYPVPPTAQSEREDR